MPPAVKLAAVFSVRPTLDPDIIAAEIVEALKAVLARSLNKIARSMNLDKRGREVVGLQAHYVLTVKPLGSTLVASTRALNSM
jgi:hypothetical protein